LKIVNLLSELTVVIVSYERQPYLDRQINFWSDKKAKVEILDGSALFWPRAHEKSFPPNVAYWHIPDTIEKRFAFAVDRIKTKYAVLMSDDEFYLPSALQSCLFELERSYELVACKGLSLGFHWSTDMVVGYQFYPGLRGYAIDQDDPKKRMIAHMNSYQMATLWAVMKSEVFKKTLIAMSYSGPYGSAAVGEIQTSLVTAWFGKCKVIDELMWLRSFENKNIWWAFGRQSFHEWYSNPQNEKEVDNFNEAIIRSINVNDLNEKQTRIDINEAILAYVVSQFNRKRFSTNILNRLRISITKHVPLNIKIQLKNLIAILQNKGGFKIPAELTLLHAAINLSNTGTRVNFKELTEISELITQFHFENSN